MKHTITTHNLSVWYNGFQALKNISLGIPEHEITALIGASGSGKTTFLRCLNRMTELTPTARISGTIQFHTTDILSKETNVICLRRHIGMVFQNPTPFPKSIYENVSYGLEIQGIKRNNSTKVFGLFRRHRTSTEVELSADPLDRRVVESLKESALWDEVKDRLDVSAFRLSGGQQQRLCIARAIAVRPQVILFDEPCSQLDPISTRKIEELLLELKKHYTVVIITHNLYQAKRISDYLGFFHLGELVEFGPTKKLFTNASQELTRTYIQGGFG